jgi:hypothetical protein
MAKKKNGEEESADTRAESSHDADGRGYESAPKRIREKFYRWIKRHANQDKIASENSEEASRKNPWRFKAPFDDLRRRLDTAEGRPFEETKTNQAPAEPEQITQHASNQSQ